MSLFKRFEFNVLDEIDISFKVLLKQQVKKITI